MQRYETHIGRGEREVPGAKESVEGARRCAEGGECIGRCYLRHGEDVQVGDGTMGEDRQGWFGSEGREGMHVGQVLCVHVQA